MGDELSGLADGVGKLLGESAKTAGEAAVDGAIGAPAADATGQAARDAVGAALTSQAEKFLWDFAQNAVDGTQVVFHYVIDLLLTMTAPQITGEFIYTMGGRIFYISLPLIVLFAVIRIITDSLRARALAGAQAAFLGAGASVLGTVALLPLTALAVRAVDAVADGMLTATLNDGDEFVDEIMTAIVQFGTVVGNMVEGNEMSGPVEAWAVPAGGAMATAIICFCCIAVLLVACFIVGLALVARNMLLYLVTVTGPLCLSGLSWEPTRKWASIWLGWMVALIFTKLAIVVAIGLGVLAISQPWSGGDSAVVAILATVFAGILMLVLAMFMPVVCFALFGFMGEAGVRELSNAAEGAQGVLKSAGESTLQAGQTAKERLGSVLEKTATGGGGGGTDPGLVPTSGGSSEDSTGSNGQGVPVDGGAGSAAATGVEQGSNTGESIAGAGNSDGSTGSGGQGVPVDGGAGSAAATGVEQGSSAGESIAGTGDGPTAAEAGDERTSGPAPSGPESSRSEEPYSWEQPADPAPMDSEQQRRDDFLAGGPPVGVSMGASADEGDPK